MTTNKPMTPEAVEFFKRPDVVEFVREVRAVVPDAQFAMAGPFSALCALPALGYYCRTSLLVDTAIRYLTGYFAAEPGRSALWAEVAATGNRLIDEDGESYPERLPAPATIPAPPPAQLCACGQEIRLVEFKACGDCRAESKKRVTREGLDRRISAVRVDVDPRSSWGAWQSASWDSDR